MSWLRCGVVLLDCDQSNYADHPHASVKITAIRTYQTYHCRVHISCKKNFLMVEEGKSQATDK